jgi:hypothetical protein
MTRLVALLATLTLALAVLFRFPLEYRIIICIIVSTTTVILAVRSLLCRKLALALLFLAVLGFFTPFQINRFSPALVSIVDMATLALFAAAPIILKKSALAVTTPKGS